MNGALGLPVVRMVEGRGRGSAKDMVVHNREKNNPSCAKSKGNRPNLRNNLNKALKVLFLLLGFINPLMALQAAARNQDEGKM